MYRDPRNPSLHCCLTLVKKNHCQFSQDLLTAERFYFIKFTFKNWGSLKGEEYKISLKSEFGNFQD